MSTTTLVAPRPVSVLKSELCTHRSRLGRPYSRLDCPLCVGRTAFANSRLDDTAAARELRKIMAIPKKQPAAVRHTPPQQCHRTYNAASHPAHSPDASPNSSPVDATVTTDADANADADAEVKRPIVVSFERPMTAPRPLRLSSLTAASVSNKEKAPTPSNDATHKMGDGLTVANLLELENFDLDPDADADGEGGIRTRDRIDSWASDTSEASTFSAYSSLYYSGIGYSRSSSADSITGYGARSPRTSFSQRFGASPPSRAENPIALNTPFHRVDPRYDDTFAVFDQIVGRRSRGNSFNSLAQPMVTRARSGSGIGFGGGGRSRGNSRENFMMSLQQPAGSPASPGSFGRAHSMSFDGDLSGKPNTGAKGTGGANRQNGGSGSLLTPLSATRTRSVSGGADRLSPITVGRERTDSSGSRRASVALSPKLSPAWMVPSLDGRGPSPMSLKASQRRTVGRSGSSTALAMSAASASRKIAAAQQQKKRNYRTMPGSGSGGRERSSSATATRGTPSPPTPAIARADSDVANHQSKQPKRVSPTPLANGSSSSSTKAQQLHTSPQLSRTPSPAQIAAMSKSSSTKITALKKSSRQNGDAKIAKSDTKAARSSTLPKKDSEITAAGTTVTEKDKEKARKKIFGIRLPRRRNSSKKTAKSATMPAAVATPAATTSACSSNTQDLATQQDKVHHVESKGGVSVSGSWASLKKK